MIAIAKFFHSDDGPDSEKVLPLMPMRDMVLFPHITAPVFVGREKSINALSAAMENDRQIFLAAQKDPQIADPGSEDIFHVGTQARVSQLIRLPDGTVKVLMKGQMRGRILHMLPGKDFFEVQFSPVQETPLSESLAEAARRTLDDAFRQYANLSGTISNDFFKGLASFANDDSKFADVIASHLSLKMEDRQELLESGDLEERFVLLLKMIQREIQLLSLSQKIKGRVKEQMDDNQKRHYLAEQIRAIKKEMGDDIDPDAHLDDLEERMAKKRMPKEAEKVVKKELEKLKMMPPVSSEATIVRNYIDWILDLPWYRKKRASIDIQKAAAILDADHYGLEKPKERIIEYLAVQKLVKKIKGPILCLVGPPGVGKTSLARSVAAATGRSFTRISLGGVRDEAEIRGHRRTYVGAMPGKIIQALKKVGFNNPVFCLDEIDKMAMDFRGDPSSALLEALDPEQNQNFNDHYMEVDYDLSDILFITTANTLDDIPMPLKDRMEIIQIPGYPIYEKENIARHHLLPKQLQENGLKKEDVIFSKNALLRVISAYTREAGVRNLERTISAICRKIATKIVQTSQRKPYQITVQNLHTYIGPPRFRDTRLEKKDQVGIVAGLAWTQAGGEILTIEAVSMKGSGKMVVTGKLGDVMKESCQAAVSYVRARSHELGVPEDFHENLDIHIHVPEGAIPKDGPSAGIAMCTAVLSVLTGVPISRTLAMTGEITLRGRVLPIGGLKEKLIAAHTNGIEKVLIPQDNRKDMEEIPKRITNQLDMVFVENMDQVLAHALPAAPS